MSENLFIFDAEIRYGVTTDDNPPQEGFQYAKGWDDFGGMGISTVCGYDLAQARYRVFMEDNIDELRAVIASGATMLGFNNHRFDNPLLTANGIDIPDDQSEDLAACIWAALGVESGQHPKGLGLDAICSANGLASKTGHGKDAPQDYQRGHIGRLIDYCLGDVRATLQLYRYIHTCGGIKDPRTGNWVVVRLPV